MAQRVSLADVSTWKQFAVSSEVGFLPDIDPATRLPSGLEPWDELGAELPKRLVTGTLQAALRGLPPIRPEMLEDPRALRRAMLILSYLGHAWVWGGKTARDRIPSELAVPWVEVAGKLGRPPVLSYASYALDNWRRLDSGRAIALDNIALLQNFLGGADEDWFIGVHIEIEAKAAGLLRVIPAAHAAVHHQDASALEAALGSVAETLESIAGTLSRMPELCDPYIYYLRVRPYIHGWKDHPLLPRGVIYEGVESLDGRPQQFRGETGAQSTIVPTIDALLGVRHPEDPLRHYLREMRDYMPPGHRAFLEAIEAGPDLRACVQRHAGSRSLAEAYDACLHWLEQFRSVHLQYAAEYIHKQGQKSAANPTHVGTGGTPFMPYLAKHRDDTARHRGPGKED